MEITHNWNIRRLIQKNDDSGVVTQVYFKVHSRSGEYYYVSAGMIELDTDNIQNLISYNQLTEDMVIEWVKNKLGTDHKNFEIMNEEKINLMRNALIQEIKEEPLPWT